MRRAGLFLASTKVSQKHLAGHCGGQVATLVIDIRLFLWFKRDLFKLAPCIKGGGEAKIEILTEDEQSKSNNDAVGFLASSTS